MNAAAQNTGVINPANTADSTNSTNPPATPNASSSAAPISADNNLPAEDKVEMAPAVATEVNETAHPQATAEQTAVTTTQEVKPSRPHKSVIAKKTSHFSEKKPG